MNKYLVLLVFLLVISCQEKQGELELEILNNEIFSCQNSDDEQYDLKSLNIIRYKLTNNTKTTYYFNKNLHNLLPTMNLGSINQQENTFFIDEDGNTAKTPFICRYPTDSFYVYNKIKDRFDALSAQTLGYGKYSWDLPLKNNFLIHPGESLYFEYFVHLPIDYTDTDLSYFVFKKNKKYKMKIQIFSDSVNYKKLIRKPDISTIKENKYLVFHGSITSKNEVPVKFINCN